MITKESSQAVTWYIIYEDKEKFIVLKKIPGHKLLLQVEKNIKLACTYFLVHHFTEFLSGNSIHSEKQYISTILEDRFVTDIYELKSHKAV